jgi:hypothetical protein
LQTQQNHSRFWTCHLLKWKMWTSECCLTWLHAVTHSGSVSQWR